MRSSQISALSSGKIHKYGYLTGEDILPSNQQQIIEQAKFTYSPLGKAFEKQIKTIKDQGKKQVDVLENLKSKEETRTNEDKSNNKTKATIVFNDLINKRKAYEYKDSKELFNAIKSNQIKFGDVKNKKN